MILVPPARGPVKRNFPPISPRFPVDYAKKGNKTMLKWKKMEIIDPDSQELEFFPSLINVLTSEEAVEAREKADREYIEQLETRIAVTDPARYPRFVKRLKAEVEIVRNS